MTAVSVRYPLVGGSRPARRLSVSSSTNSLRSLPARTRTCRRQDVRADAQGQQQQPGPPLPPPLPPAASLGFVQGAINDYDK
jgi:hypothetical protein